MKKLRLLLALFVASIGAVQNASARVAPTLPETQTLADGQYYYLYNVMEGKFLCKSSTDSYYAGLGTYGDKLLFTATEEDNGYQIKWADNERLLEAYDTYVTSTSYPGGWRDFFIFSEASKGYCFQRSSKNTNYYKADEFVGFDGSNGDRLTPALSEGSIYWQLFSEEDAEYYMAKHKLYTYMEVADQYNFYITQYEQVYENPASTTAELDLAQSTLKNALDMSQNYVSPSWSEYPILFQNNTNNKWTLDYGNTRFVWNPYVGPGYEGSSTLSAIVDVDNDATLVFTYKEGGTFRVYLDGELVESITQTGRRYYIEMSPGKHEINWTTLINHGGTWSGTWYNSLSEIGVINSPTIVPATTTVEGQLGTEVLKVIYPESASSVKKIKINGIIGEDDWTTIGLMVNALSIDMSGATATKIPASMFTKSKYPFLHEVKLPQGITEIGEQAFYQSDLENDIVIPETVTNIGYDAFRNTKIKNVTLPEGLTTMGNGVFNQCYWLESANIPASVGRIPDYTFYQCYKLRTFTIPEGITWIGSFAFSDCSQFNPRFPSTLSHIYRYAFSNTATDELYITEGMTVDAYAFSRCQNLVYAEWPTTFYDAYDSGENGTSPVVYNCPKLTTVKLKSPTVVTYNYQSFFSGNTLSNITLLVPDYLEFAYRLDPYWYQCKVESFNSAEITDWNIRQPLVLNAGQRIGGTPSLDVRSGGSITVNGDDVQTINNLKIDYSQRGFNYYNNGSKWIGQQWGMMLGNTDKVNITGELSEWVLTEEKRWYFLTLPFDTKVGDIEAHSYAGGTTSYAVRYYDGAQRAATGTGSSWKNYEADDIIPAGTGFIFQTAKAAYSKFVAQDNASKQYILSNREFVKALEANPSDVNANKGWNLVGNPWQTYYNIHKLNFTAPITVWDNSANNGYGNYVAYSIIDDDYAIKPLEAIFVQCPDEVNSISFPIDGRQLTDVIESQNAARAATQSERRLIDVVLSDGEMTDKTRFVMNPQALVDYELERDASKFFSMDAAMPQLYTIEQGQPLAINERPVADGTVKLGFRVAKDGQYTISAPRNQFKNIVLLDTETGLETDLSSTDGYAFSAQVGTCDSRFILRVGGVVVTDISEIGNEQLNTENEVYDIQGRKIVNSKSVNSKLQRGLYIVNGKKVMK
ncbi:MAG: leucine-rich repeat domain-containing protein [Prevotella sp.]|nr:leucine-rich repeat domain-containing protein [Prevotella sp.]MBR6275673.1 leucine-rich repeat domain-containing protein [Prevotella sp.]